MPGPFKLGKLPPKIDKRTLLLDNFLDVSAVVAPNEQDYLKRGPGYWGMMANDRVGDCTVAALSHQLQQWTANVGSIVTCSDAAVLEGYAAISAYPERDEGAYCIDALNWLRKTGLLGPDGKRHKIMAYAKVNPRHHGMVRAACLVGSGLYIGATLHDSIWDSVVWDAPVPGDTLAGGHAMNIGLVGSQLAVITWARKQPVTWAWWDAEVDECYCLISEDSLDAAGRSVIGLDLNAMLREVEKVTA